MMRKHGGHPGRADTLDLLNRADELARQARFAEAIDLYEAYIGSNPRSAAAFYKKGMALHSIGDFAGAVRSYDRAIRIDPHHADAHGERGIALKELKRFDEALRSYDHAIRADPSYAEAYYNRAIVLTHLHRPDEALASYERARQINPSLMMAYLNTGVLLRDLSRPEEAVAIYDEALRRNTGFAALHNNKGNALNDLNRYADALASFDRAIATKPDYAEAHYNRGNALCMLERFADAAKSYDRALAIAPGYAEAHMSRGHALHALKRFEEGLASSDRAIALRPDYAEAHSNRGAALTKLSRYDGALMSCDRAIALSPDYAEAHSNRGAVLTKLERYDDALMSCDRALALSPDYAEGHLNRGVALYELSRFEEALASYDRVIELAPGMAVARMNKGLSLLLLGDFRRGWETNEARKSTPERIGARDYPQPVWTGAESIAGKTLFIYWEQGLGDTIQFCRYAKLAEARGAKAILSVQDALMRLLGNLSPSLEIVAAQTTPTQFDYHAALLSMPLAFATDARNIPADISYLRAEPDRIESWKHQLGEDGLKIGVAWQGSKLGTELGKAFPPAALHGISKLPGVRLISLQKGEGSEQLAMLPDGMTVETLGDDFDAGPDAFLDTAAVMENLDLIITTDTSIAHLAGALGRPTWIALRHVPDWRWLLDRDDSPWYPTVRLFRQQTRGDWTSVFAAMEGELISMVGQAPDAAPSQITSLD